MVTVNGRPFKALSDSGFGNILDPILKGFGSFTLSPENIRDMVEGKAKELRRKVSVKMDCATRLDRALLGINLQFNKKGKNSALHSCHHRGEKKSHSSKL